MDTEEIQHLQALREILQKRLRVLELQAARLGLQAPPHILTEIEDLQLQIARVAEQLEIITTDTSTKDLVVISSSTQRPLAIIGKGAECWLKLAKGDPVDLTFYEKAQITYGTSTDGDTRFFFIAEKGDKISNVTGATIRPMLHVTFKFGSIDHLKKHEIDYHSGRVEGGWETCLRDHNDEDKPLNALCDE